MKFKLRNKSKAPQLALTSMLDVIFLLLCFFVTISVFSQWENEITIKLPSAVTAEEPDRLPGEIVVNLATDGKVTVNGTRLGLIELEERLAKVSKFYPDQAVIILADRTHDCGRPIGEHFRCTGSNRAGGEPHVQHSIRPQLLRLLHHAGRRLPPRFRQQFGVALELAADHVFESGGNVPAEMLRPHRISLHHALELDDLVARHSFCIHNYHFSPHFRYYVTFYHTTLHHTRVVRICQPSDRRTTAVVRVLPSPNRCTHSCLWMPPVRLLARGFQNHDARHRSEALWIVQMPD